MSRQLFAREFRYMNALNNAIQAGHSFNIYRNEQGAIKLYPIAELIVNIYTGAMSVAYQAEGDIRTTEVVTELDLKAISSQAKLYQSRQQSR